MNVVNLIGRTTREPEIRMTKDGEKVASFTVAVNRVGKKDEADFIPCIAFRQLAEVMEEYVGKGNQIGVQGSLNFSTYEKDGEKKTSAKVIANRVDLISTERKKSENGYKQLDDDIPF